MFPEAGGVLFGVFGEQMNIQYVPMNRNIQQFRTTEPLTITVFSNLLFWTVFSKNACINARQIGSDGTYSLNLISSSFFESVAMRLSNPQLRDIIPHLWNDPGMSGKQYIDVLYTTAKFASSRLELLETLNAYAEYRVASACCTGLRKVVNCERDEMIGYFNSCMMLFNLWIDECLDTRYELAIGGTIFVDIVPIGLQASKHSDKSALLLMKFLHFYLGGYDRFLNVCTDALMIGVMDALFEAGFRWKGNTELRTLFFSMLRDSPFRDYNRLFVRKWKDHRSKEWDFFFGECDGLRYDHVKVELSAELCKGLAEIQEFTFLSMKKEANCLLKLNLHLDRSKDLELRLRALEDGASKSFQDQEDRSSSGEIRPAKRARRLASVNEYSRSQGFIVANLVSRFFTKRQEEPVVNSDNGSDTDSDATVEL